MGLPVIGSTVGMNQMIISDNLGIGVEELKPDEWTNAIMKMAGDFTLWKFFSKNAYKEWEGLYGYESNLLKWKEIIKS